MGLCERCHSEIFYGGTELSDGESVPECDGGGVLVTSEMRLVCCPFWNSFIKQAHSGNMAAVASNRWPIPKIFAQADLKRPGMPPLNQAYAQCSNWLSSEARKTGSLIISGSHGSGKSHLAAAMAHKCSAKGWRVAWANAASLMQRFRATYDRGDETEADIIRDLCNAELLVLDDLGKQTTSQHSDEKLFQIVDERYSNELPVVITRNDGADPVGGEDILRAVRSRLKHNAVVIQMPLVDWRAARD